MRSIRISFSFCLLVRLISLIPLLFTGGARAHCCSRSVLVESLLRTIRLSSGRASSTLYGHFSSPLGLSPPFYELLSVFCHAISSSVFIWSYCQIGAHVLPFEFAVRQTHGLGPSRCQRLLHGICCGQPSRFRQFHHSNGHGKEWNLVFFLLSSDFCIGLAHEIMHRGVLFNSYFAFPQCSLRFYGDALSLVLPFLFVC